MERWIGLVLVTVLVAACGASGTPSTTLGHEPYPYTRPTPPHEPTAIDGLYARLVTSDVVGGDTPCRRCPPYRLATGYETLGLEQGTFKVYHWASGYMSVGHYLVDGDTVTFFNDPNCPQDRGSYDATPTEDHLAFDTIHDPCAFDQVRERFLTALPWQRATPPEAIYESAAGSNLMLLDGRFELVTVEESTVGQSSISASTLILTAGDCTQELDWELNHRTLVLDAREPRCDWAEALSESSWQRAG